MEHYLFNVFCEGNGCPLFLSQWLMFLKPLKSSDFTKKVDFAEGEKPEYLEKNPQSQII